MSLVVLAIGLEVYQVLAHIHCLSGRTLPGSHRTTLGFGAAIVGDAGSYLASSIALYLAGGPWALLLAPLFAHVFYGCLLVFVRAVYLHLHDYRLPTLYADGAFCRAKLGAAVLDTGFHLLAVALLATVAPVAAGLAFAVAGVGAYLVVFTRALASGAPVPMHVGAAERRTAP